MTYNNIIVLSTEANFFLYQKTGTFFPENIRKFSIDAPNRINGNNHHFFDAIF